MLGKVPQAVWADKRSRCLLMFFAKDHRGCASLDIAQFADENLPTKIPAQAKHGTGHLIALVERSIGRANVRPWTAAHPFGSPLDTNGRVLGVLLDLVIFVGELFGCVQLSYGFIDMFHGGDPVSAPLTTGVFEVIASALQGVTGCVDFGRDVALRSTGEKGCGWGSNHE
jgi:hypothetical protein